jgi:hypothetical protein
MRLRQKGHRDRLELESAYRDAEDYVRKRTSNYTFAAV